MAISFIPNQPILFQDPLFADQTCLNSDTRQYAQLAEAEDRMCVQFINEPVSSWYSCNMTGFADVVTNGDFATDLSNWTEYNFATGVPSGTNYWTWSLNGATSDPGRNNIGLVQTLPGSVGDMFLISFEFTYDNGGDFKIGFGNAGINSWNFVNLFNNFQSNIDGRRCFIVSSYIGLDFAFFCNTSAVTIDNIVIRNINLGQCVLPLSSINKNWSYVESLNGWQKLDGTAATAFPIGLFNNLVNNTNYRLSYKVTNMPEDGIAYMEIQDGAGAVLSNTQTNGEFAEYLTPYTGPTVNPYILANPEAQNGVIYDIKIEEMCYNHNIFIAYPDNSQASIYYGISSPINPIQYYKDRIIWCFDWNTLEDYDVPLGQLNSGCYKIGIIDSCASGGNYYSYTTINYKATGSHECSVEVIGANTGYAFGFFFTDPSTNIVFTLRQRLRLLQFNPTYPVKTEQYTFSNGRMNRSYAESGKVRTAWFDYVDEPTHDVIRLQLLSETLIVGSEPFFCVAEDYEPEWAQNGKYNLAQSRVVLMAQNEPRLFNKNCI